MKSRLESRNFKVSSRLGLEAMMSRLVSIRSVFVPALTVVRLRFIPEATVDIFAEGISST